jgi:hypothetical protein
MAKVIDRVLHRVAMLICHDHCDHDYGEPCKLSKRTAALVVQGMKAELAPPKAQAETDHNDYLAVLVDEVAFDVALWEMWSNWGTQSMQEQLQTALNTRDKMVWSLEQLADGKPIPTDQWDKIKRILGQRRSIKVHNTEVTLHG